MVPVLSDLRAEIVQEKGPHFPSSLTWFPEGISSLGDGKRQPAQVHAGPLGLAKTLLIVRIPHCSSSDSTEALGCFSTVPFKQL